MRMTGRLAWSAECKVVLGTPGEGRDRPRADGDTKLHLGSSECETLRNISAETPRTSSEETSRLEASLGSTGTYVDYEVFSVCLWGWRW